MEIHDGVRLPAVQREIYESAIKHLNETVAEARRSRHSPCEHRIVQTDEYGCALPCAYPECPAGIRYGWSLQYEAPVHSTSYADWAADEALKPIQVNRKTYRRQFVEGLADVGPRLYLWVNSEELQEHQRRERDKRYQETEQFLRRVREEDAAAEVAFAALPWWRRVAVLVRNGASRGLLRVGRRLSDWSCRLRAAGVVK
jgi:hypothetical protein